MNFPHTPSTSHTGELWLSPLGFRLGSHDLLLPAAAAAAASSPTVTLILWSEAGL